MGSRQILQGVQLRDGRIFFCCLNAFLRSFISFNTKSAISAWYKCYITKRKCILKTKSVDPVCRCATWTVWRYCWSMEPTPTAALEVTWHPCTCWCSQLVRQWRWVVTVIWAWSLFVASWFCCYNTAWTRTSVSLPPTATSCVRCSTWCSPRGFPISCFTCMTSPWPSYRLGFDSLTIGKLAKL